MPNDANMPSSTPCPALRFSRRQILGGAAVSAGGFLFLIGTTQEAAALMPQKAAKYQDKPKGKQMCSGCTHFEPPSSCGIVQGPISPHGWCMFFVAK